jgi:hypothetical protein
VKGKEGTERSGLQPRLKALSHKPYFGHVNKEEMFFTMFLYERVPTSHETSCSEAQVIHFGQPTETRVAYGSEPGLAAGSCETDEPHMR